MPRSAPVVLIAGATGYLGRHLISAYHRAGYRVHALARRPESLISLDGQIDRICFGEATRPETLAGLFEGVDLVISALGITRQRDGLGYGQVDYQANLNLLNGALEAKVPHFAYIHVLNAGRMPGVAMVAAKARFVAELESAPIRSTIICPSGFFSDLSEVLDMARGGRVFLFGNGQTRMSPIDGSDLAPVCVQATEQALPWLDVGGPEVLTHNEIARAAFAALGKVPRITHIPSAPARWALALAKRLGWRQRLGPLDFFVEASRIDMSAPAHGTMRLEQYFAGQAR